MEKRILYTGGEGYYEEKKSRFYATAIAVSSEEEVQEFLEKRRKERWDARHHCYAYVIGEGNPLKRAADDGEPSGTAGKPILDVIEGENLTDTLIVVTRYFGGTLLGTGGLVRSYREAAKDALQNSEIAERKNGRRFAVTIPYTEQGKISYLLRTNSIFVLDETYTDQVTFLVLVDESGYEHAVSLLTEETGGKAVLSSGEVVPYVAGKQGPVLL